MDAPMPVILALVRKQPIEERLPLVGSLRAKEEVRLMSELDGRVLSARFPEGSHVEAGQVLFKLDSRRQHARLDEARARLDLANSELKRGEELAAKNSLPAQELDRLKANQRTAEAAVDLIQADFEDAEVKAPFAGLVSERLVSEGQFVARGAELATLVQEDPLEVEFGVPERFAGRVKPGQTVQMETVAYQGEKFEGNVSYIAPQVDSISRTLTVKADVKNVSSRLRPGMFGSVEIVFQAKPEALVVPESSIYFQGDQAFATRIDGNRIAAIVPVKVGLRMGGFAEIVDGLAGGDLVIAEGFQKVAPGGKVMALPGSAKYGVDPDPMPGAAPAGGTEPSDVSGDTDGAATREAKKQP